MTENGDHDPDFPAAQGTLPRVFWVLYFAFLAACFIYGGIIQSDLLMPGSGVQIDPPFPPILWYLIALSSIASGIIVPPLACPITDQTDPGTFLRQAQTQMIIRAALFESVAIYGLVSLFFGVSKTQALIFVGISVVALLCMLPNLRGTMDRYELMKRS